MEQTGAPMAGFKTYNNALYWVDGLGFAHRYGTTQDATSPQIIANLRYAFLQDAQELINLRRLCPDPVLKMCMAGISRKGIRALVDNMAIEGLEDTGEILGVGVFDPRTSPPGVIYCVNASQSLTYGVFPFLQKVSETPSKQWYMQNILEPPIIEIFETTSQLCAAGFPHQFIDKQKNISAGLMARAGIGVPRP